MTSELTVLVDCMKQKNADNWSIVLECGEKSLTEKVVSMLELNMQTAHFEIAQLVANMSKLAGKLNQWWLLGWFYSGLQGV